MDSIGEQLVAAGLSGTMSLRLRPQPGRVALPDASCDLIWREERAFLSGPSSRGKPIDTAGGELQLVNLDPLPLRSLLGIPMRELTDLTVPLSDVLPNLEGMVSDLFHFGRAGTLVTGTRSHEPSSRRVAHAMAAIASGRSVATTASDVSLSERQLQRHFDDAVGLSPRRYRRIVRLRQAVELVNGGESFAATAALAGFADQSHFTREVQALTGLNPRALMPNVGKLQDSDVRTREY